MNQETIDRVKIFLNNTCQKIIKTKKYNQFDDVQIFFVFGSNVRTAMCDWVYGMKIYTKSSFVKRDELVLELQREIKNIFEKFFQQSICATDIIFEKEY